MTQPDQLNETGCSELSSLQSRIFPPLCFRLSSSFSLRLLRHFPQRFFLVVSYEVPSASAARCLIGRDLCPCPPFSLFPFPFLPKLILTSLLFFCTLFCLCFELALAAIFSCRLPTMLPFAVPLTQRYGLLPYSPYKDLFLSLPYFSGAEHPRAMLFFSRFTICLFFLWKLPPFVRVKSFQFPLAAIFPVTLLLGPNLVRRVSRPMLKVPGFNLLCRRR